MDKNVLMIRWACPTNARRALFDFALLSILIYMFLAFVYPDKIYHYFYLSMPQLILVLLSKSKKDYVYPFGIALAIVSVTIGIFQGIYPVSLIEWGTFFKLGYSLHFSELADLLFFTNFAGIIYFSIKSLKLKEETN